MTDHSGLQSRLKAHQSAEARKELLSRGLTLDQARYILGVVAQTKRTHDANDYVIETPTKRQQEFLNVTTLECLFGGAASGGKSSALLHVAIRAACGGSAVLVVRKTFADLNLPGAIMDRSHGWLGGTEAKWHGMDKRWTFPSGGVIQFGYLDNAKDKYRYQGSEFQCLCVDELTQFEESDYLYLISRIRRTTKSKRPLEIRSATNPGGIGHDWVKKRFITDPQGRVFIPATLTDNPHIDQIAYKAALEMLDATTRNQLLHGAWVRDDGGQLYSYAEHRNAVHELPPKTPVARYVLGIDLGASQRDATTAFVVVQYSDHEPNLICVVKSAVFAGMTPSSCASEIKQWQRLYDFDAIVCDAGALGVGYVEEFRQRHGLPVRAAQKKDKLGMRKIMNGDLERGCLTVFEPANTQLVAELYATQWNSKGTDAQEGQPIHLTDALLYSYREAKAFASAEPERAPEDPIKRAEWTAQKMQDEVIRKVNNTRNKRRGAMGGFLDE